MATATPARVQTDHVSIWSRKADLVYLIFFIIHIVVMLSVDLVGLYPDWFTPSLLLDLRDFYSETYQDKFFTEPALWAKAYVVMEAVYHLPLSIWAIRALVEDNAMVPVHLLVWAVQTTITTLTCLADVWGWTDRTWEQKKQLTALYGPYILFVADENDQSFGESPAVVLGLDMFFRLEKRLARKSKSD